MSHQTYWFLIGYAAGLGTFLLTGLAIILFACWRVRHEPKTLIHDPKTGQWIPQ